MASSSKRAKRNNKRNKKQQSISTSGSESTAPTYLVEEDSNGELVNRRTGVVWPERTQRSVKRYPDHSSGQSLVNGDRDQFATSPYEMISIAELDAAAKGGKPRADGGYRPRSRGCHRSSRGSSSPQYVSLSGRAKEEEHDDEEEKEKYADTDDSTGKIDSVVFDTAEELARYQRILGAIARETAKYKAAAAAEKEKAAAKEEDAVSSVASSVVPPKGERNETERHYIGIRSRRAVERKLTPGQFYVYYEKPAANEIPVKIELKIGYMSSASKIHHFPIQRYECQGEPYYAVMQSDRDVKMFPSIALLVQHYHTFSNVDPETGRLETFALPV